jgi:hypothetical protein
MCCAADGKCIEPKHCYGTGDEGKFDLKADVPSKVITPSVNSTSVPYFYDPANEGYQVTPCFEYVYESGTLGTLSGDKWKISSTQKYSEPKLWLAEKSSVLVLNDYWFAYGNGMSDSEDQPYSISTSGQQSSNSNSRPNPEGGFDDVAYDESSSSMELAKSPAMDSSAAMMPYPDYGYYGNYGYYYGGYQNYDQYAESTYSSHSDSKGYYSYSKYGNYERYSANYFNGETKQRECNGDSGEVCYYTTTNSYWAAYSRADKKCTPHTKWFVSGWSEYQTTMIVLGAVFGFGALCFGTTGSCMLKKRKV